MTNHIPKKPDLTYNNTAGYSDHGNSKKRAKRRVSTGKEAVDQDTCYRLVVEAGRKGKTYSEINDERYDGKEHSSVTSALSNMHKTGRLVKLAESRGDCGVYVHPAKVDGRKTVLHGSLRLSKAQKAVLAVRAVLDKQAVQASSRAQWVKVEDVERALEEFGL